MFLTGVPIIGTLGGVGAYVVVNMNKSKEDSQSAPMNQYTGADNVTDSSGNNNEDLVDKFQVFPVVKRNQFYKYIRVSHGGAIFDQNFIAQVANFVIKNMQISDGKIEWGYETNLYKDDLKMTFKWIASNQGRVFTKTYKFSLTKDV